MRKAMTIGIAAIALGGAGMAWAQSLTVAPKGTQMMPVSQNQIAQLQTQIDALKAKVAAQENTIAGMKIQVQKIAVSGFANKGDLANLEKKLESGGPAIQSLYMADRDLNSKIAATNASLAAANTRFEGHKHNYREFGQLNGKQVMTVATSYAAGERCSKSPAGSVNCVPGAPY